MHKGIHRYVHLNYGTSVASNVLQYAISQALASIKGVINISDDTHIFGSTQSTHDAAVRKVFEWLHQVGLTLNKLKCTYNKSTLEFFGMIFSVDEVSPDPKIGAYCQHQWSLQFTWHDKLLLKIHYEQCKHHSTSTPTHKEECQIWIAACPQKNLENINKSIHLISSHGIFMYRTHSRCKSNSFRRHLTTAYDWKGRS